MKRLCIYVTYDKEGIIDRYVTYMLKELKSCSTELVVICNCLQISQGLEYLQPYADHIFFRENIGFDAGGFRDAICNYIGWDLIETYDEILLVNDSLFGPFCPMRDIFDDMEQKECDFWGLSTCKICLGRDDQVFTPEHIQSFFILFRSSLLHSTLFRDFWESMPYYHAYWDVVKKYEIHITDYFHKAGYQYACYADVRENYSNNLRNAYNQYEWIPDELVRKRKFPFLKKKCINHDPRNKKTQEDIRNVFDYIKDHTDYDINMIYENIIRLMNVSDLQRRMCLHYILPYKYHQGKRSGVKAIIVIVAEHRNCCESVMQYVEQISDRCSVLFLSESVSVLNFYKQKGFACIECVENNKKLIIDRLVSFNIVGIVHDADMSCDRRPNYVGKSRLYHIWENMAGSACYVDNVLNLFLENEKLGLLTIPRASFEDYFGDMGSGWDGNYDIIQKLIRKYDIHCKLDYMKPPFEPVHDYWVRGEMFERIREMDVEFLKFLPWIWCYLVQEHGCFSGIVENKKLAEMNMINRQYYLDIICEQVKKQFGEFRNLEQLRNLLSKRALADYCTKYKQVYIYGTGYIAEVFSAHIPNIKAYVVSDGQNKRQEFHGRKVIYFSEIKRYEDTGMVICLDPQNQSEVIARIKGSGFQDYFCV